MASAIATANPATQVRVGIGVFVLRPAQTSFHATNTDDVDFIIGKRKGSLGSGTWALAGGHLEVGESFEACAAREVLEETGLEITDIQFLTAVNTIMADGQRHYVTIFMKARLADPAFDVPMLLEPDKCDGWTWIGWRQFRAWAEEEIRRAQVGQAQGSNEEQKKSPSKGKIFAALLALVEQRPEAVPAL